MPDSHSSDEPPPDIPLDGLPPEDHSETFINGENVGEQPTSSAEGGDSAQPQADSGEEKRENASGPPADEAIPAVSGNADSPDGAPDLHKPAEEKPKVLRPLPSSIDMERATLCCLLRAGRELIEEMTEKMPTGAEIFHAPAHQLIFDTIIGLNQENHPVDIMTVTQRLGDQGDIDKAGGPAYITELPHYTATTAHFSYYLEALRYKYVLRRIIAACSECMEEAHTNPDDAMALLDRVESDIFGIRKESEKRTFADIKKEVMDAMESLEEMHRNKGKVAGISTGFSGLDKLTNGLQGGQMVVIAARPSMGKTSFGLNIVEHAILKEGLKTAVFSMEMPTSQLVTRLLCSQAEVGMSDVVGGFLSKLGMARLGQAAMVLKDAPVYIDDSPSLSYLELRSKARRLQRQNGLDLILVDYLQLMRSPSRRAQENRQLEISEISSGLKALAKELDIPVLVLAQLNRGPENRGGVPRLADLRESGAIEQDADIVGLLVREKYYANTMGGKEDEAKEDPGGKSHLDIAKNRNGPTGNVPLTFLDKWMRFVDRSDEEEPDEFAPRPQAQAAHAQSRQQSGQPF